jgi:hypothetical protein
MDDNSEVSLLERLDEVINPAESEIDVKPPPPQFQAQPMESQFTAERGANPTAAAVHRKGASPPS